MPLRAAPPVPTSVPPPDNAAEEFGFAEPLIERVGDSESVTDGVVTALAQDANGWLWIGTQAGLVRYDGYRFRLFQQDASNPGALAGNYVRALWVAPDGRLWVGTNSHGLSVFDPHSERFTNIGAAGPAPGKAEGKAAAAAPNTAPNTAPNIAPNTAPTIAPTIANLKVTALAGDAAGGVWVGSDGGLDWFPAGGRAPQRFVHNQANPADLDSLADNRVLSLLVDRQGTLWVGGPGGLQRRLAGGKGFTSVAPAALAGAEIRTLFEAADGRLWIGTRQHGAAWLEPGSQWLRWLSPDPQRADHLPHGWVQAIAQPQPDRIWLATYGGGMAIADAGGRILQRLRHDPSNGNGLALDMASALLVDRAGLLWVGTWGGGLQRHNPLNHSIRNLRHSPARPAGLSFPSVRSLLELPDGTIAAGTAGNGIDILDRRRGLVGGHRPQPGQPGALGDGTVVALATTPDSALWAGTIQAGAFRLPPGGGAWQGYSSAQGLPHSTVRKLLVARDGTLWAGTSGGLARWLPERQRFEALTQAGGIPMRALVRVLAEDGQGRLWIGTDAGLWLIEPGGAVLKPIKHDPQRPDSLADNDIHGLLVDSKGRLWVSTDRGLDRLARLDGDRASFEHISVQAGKPGMNLGSNMQEDSLGRIWISGRVLWSDSLRMVQLSKADGLEIGAFWMGATATTRDGLFLRGGTEGIAVIDPARFKPWDHQPAVLATELAVDGKPLPLGALRPALTLAPDQRSFTVGFSAPDFSAPMQNRYSYKLLGFDRDWTEADSEHRSASYGNLWPGNYTLQVRGSNRLGDWSPHQLTVPVKVLPAFWQTGWFAALALLALGGAAFGTYRWRVAALRARARQLEGLVEQRTSDIVAAHASLQATQLQLIESERMLFQAEKVAALGGLVVGMAHEINTPVGIGVTAASSLHGSAAEFARKYSSGQMKKADLADFVETSTSTSELILTNLKRADSLIQTFKQISLEQSGEAKTRFKLRDQIDAVFAALRPQLGAAGVALQVDCPEGLEFDSYADVLTQILILLTENALLHAFPAGQQGRLTLEARAEGQSLCLRFGDDGMGIGADVMGKIYDPFFTTKRSLGKTGLGLHIVHNLVTQAFRGSIECQSAPGQGCLFILTLNMG